VQLVEFGHMWTELRLSVLRLRHSNWQEVLLAEPWVGVAIAIYDFADCMHGK